MLLLANINTNQYGVATESELLYNLTDYGKCPKKDQQLIQEANGR